MLWTSMNTFLVCSYIYFFADFNQEHEQTLKNRITEAATESDFLGGKKSSCEKA